MDAGVRIVVPIIGMHRSGTSATAGCLKLAGLDFGPESLLMRASPANPKGYFESLEVVGIHERLLRGLGAKWDDPQLRGDWELTLPARVAKAALSKWLSRANRPGPMGVKDPRACLFGPLWRSAARSVGIELRPLIVTRETDAVAHSLARRDGMSAGHARDLMAIYGSGVLDWMLGTSRAPHIHFEDLLADPRGTLEPVLPKLTLPGPFDWAAIEDFVDEDLTHA